MNINQIAKVSSFSIFRIMIVALLTSLGTAFAQDLSAQWKLVDEADNKDQPKTAITLLEQISQAAVQGEKWDDALFAAARKAILQGRIEEGEQAYGALLRLEEARKTASPKMHPFLDALIAEWYVKYFLDNRWMFAQRTQIAGSDEGKDIGKWSLPRIVKEVGDRFDRVLTTPQRFFAYPIKDFSRCFTPGNVDDEYRPTIYDLLAHRAIDFYSSAEQGLLDNDPDFIVTTDMPLLAQPEQFMKWAEKEFSLKDSGIKKALFITAQRMRANQVAGRQIAYADADFNRLLLVKRLFNAVGVDTDDAYDKTLEAFVSRWSDNEVLTRAIAAQADRMFAQKKYVEAKKRAEEGMKLFPKSVGAQECNAVIARVLQPSMQIQTPNVWAKTKPEVRPYGQLEITCRNVTQIRFRLYPLNHENEEDRNIWDIEKLLKRQLIKEWNVDIVSENYQEVIQKQDILEPYKNGMYALVATAQGNVHYVTPIQVSDLCVERMNRGQYDLRVCNNESGLPVANAQITAKVKNNQKKALDIRNYTTDALGRAVLEKLPNGEATLYIKSGDDTFIDAIGWSWGNERHPEVQDDSRVMLLTDRSIYRPGQTVFYKGIYYVVNQATGKYEIRPQAHYTIRFMDPNGQEITSRKEKANEFGSFTGSFVIPKDKGTGHMSLQMDHGSVSFNVEEYKRPKFEVTFDPIKDEFKLNADVTLNGRATTYSGLPLSKSKVKWRVERRSQYPWWCWWRVTQPKVLETGTAETGEDGTFKTIFLAKPELDAKPEEAPKFIYTVTAEVIDSTGETRAGSQSLTLGFTALSITVQAPEWFKANEKQEVTVLINTMNGAPVAATKGEIRMIPLKQPDRPIPFEEPRHYNHYWNRSGASSKKPKAEQPIDWEASGQAAEESFKTGDAGNVKIPFTLKPGIYRVEVTTKDKFGNPATDKAVIQVFNPADANYPIKVPSKLAVEKQQMEVGETFRALWGSGYPTAYGEIEIWRDNKLLKRFLSEPGKTQMLMEYPVTEDLRGGFTVRYSMVRENKFYQEYRQINVPWSNKAFTLNWTHINSKIEPNVKEKWTLCVKNPDGTPAKAELLASMFDASLDAFLIHQWNMGFGLRGESTYFYNLQFSNITSTMQPRTHFQHHGGYHAQYRHWAYQLLQNQHNMRYAKKSRGVFAGRAMPMMAMEAEGNMVMDAAAPAAATTMAMPAEKAERKSMDKSDADGTKTRQEGGTGAKPADAPMVRKNLNETAFFLPMLTTDAEGTVSIAFSAPEALTGWRVMAFAHDQKLNSGYIEAKVVTQKKLMVEPSMPRFLREGDEIELSVKVTNTSDAKQKGKVSLKFSDKLKELGEEKFALEAGKSVSVKWVVKVPDTAAGITKYTVLAKAEDYGDGEEGFLPILSKRVQVIESLAFSVKPQQEKKLTFKRLANISDTAEHLSLTLEVTPNATWSAILALPYLMEYPYECAEQVFHRYYANALARQIVKDNPVIEKVFKQWKAETLDSPLQKNQELKSLMIEETPWLATALKEKEQRNNIAILFDSARLETETKSALKKLREKRNLDGCWSWFPGGPRNIYITSLIVRGIGRLRAIGVSVDMEMALKPLPALDEEMQESIAYRKKEKHLYFSCGDASYLHMRSFFIKDAKVDKSIVDTLITWAKADHQWTKLSRYSRAQAAIAFNRFGEGELAKLIMKSVRENAVEDEEMGMSWRMPRSWWWYDAPLETQALTIEAFKEVTKEQDAVDACALWLLQQKRTSRWTTTTSTADAIYALMLGNNTMLTPTAEVDVTLGGVSIKPDTSEAGSGYFSKRYQPAEIKPAMAKIEVKNPNNAITFGALHWQYLEDIDKVTQSEDKMPIVIDRKLFVKEYTTKGPVLKPAKSVKIGDTIVTRIELRVEREMEFVHMKDTRAASIEPVDVLSSYRWQDGTGYFQSTRDTATHFFFDRLNRGTYIFEYECRVFQNGKCKAGMTEIQCMYAPEFNAHSAGMMLESK
jgi:uncharacterized protein YfaS (alpha-2-macroglobulin family)